ncbi:Two-component sensor histidine kinase, contains HisKA and HATPase domains [Rhodospirillales bacterium URHD0017]|nr:Two-component sensor histidine kinase, contains HisKA and HATPase domains [Rhodospirillales bacterium URHD0017]
MLASWSLRTRLVVVVTVALLPVLALAAWYAVREQRASQVSHVEAVVTAAELVVARHRELIEASRRMLVAMCEEDTVRLSANPDASAADIKRCEAYLGQVLQRFPNEYSSAVVTDAAGTARCSSAPTAVGMGFSDREIFRLVRETGKFAVGAQLASRVTPAAVIPMGLPILQSGEFRGMCALGISLRYFADLVTPASTAETVAVSLVDRSGMSLAGSAEAARVLPVAVRLAAAIVGGQKAFRDYGQDGQLYEFRLLPLADTSIFVLAAAPVAEGLSTLLADWGGFILVVLALAVALLAVWLGADRWCVQPLRYIRDFADRVARGDDMKLEPRRRWGPELASVGEGVRAMAAAIASREAELRAGLEQRDHMLREIHHRVKNNLQMISSLLNLQAGEIRSPRIRRFFGDAQNRVLTLSILHRHLYERSSWALVDFQQFISDLVRQISVGRRNPDRPQPRYQIRAPIMAVGPDIAIPIGLIVTEAVSSALSRSFENVTAPEIRIEAADKAGTVELTIEDNGAGAGGLHRPDIRGGFGLTLIRGLAMQLGGEAQISPREGGGMRVAVTFPMPQDQEADA